MKMFLCCALAVCIGTLLGLFSTGGGQMSAGSAPLKIERAGTGTLPASRVQRIKHQAKRLLLPKGKPEYGPYGSISKAEMVAAAKKLAPYTRVPGHILIGIADEETRLGANQGNSGMAIKKARTIEEQIMLNVLAEEHGVNPDALKVSSSSAFGLVHARPTYYLTHTGMKVEFGDTPVILLHGTDQYRKMSRAQRIASVKSLQRKLGLKGSDIDGVAGAKTLDAIQQSVGIRSLNSKVAKYRLVKRYYSDQIKVHTSKVRDKVWQRICRAQGKNPRQEKYFLPNLWDPLHALAYASIHIEDDLQIAKGNLHVAISGYFTGIGDAKAGCKKGIKYRGRVLAKARKYSTDLRS